MFELKVADLKKYETVVQEYEQQPIEKGKIPENKVHTYQNGTPFYIEE